MRKLIGIGLVAALLVLALVLPCMAETVRITWKQPAADMPYVKEWVVYTGDTANPTTELTRLPCDGSAAASYTSSVPLTVTGTPGTTVRKFISLAAVSKNGNMTAKVAGKTAAGLDYLEFTIPIPDVAVPFEVIIQIVVGP